MTLETTATSGALPDAAATNLLDEPREIHSLGSEPEEQEEAAGEDEAKAKAKEEPELSEREKELQRELDNVKKEAKSKQRRIDRITRERHEAVQPKAKAAGEELTQEDVARIIEQRADQLADQKALVKHCNSVFDAAIKLDKHFEANYKALTDDVSTFDKAGQPLPFMSAILDADTKTAAALLKHLADNPDLAEDLADLSPTKQIRRIAQLESELAAPPKEPKPSGAPKPATPVKGSVSSDEPDPADTDRWIAWDEKQQSNRKR